MDDGIHQRKREKFDWRQEQIQDETWVQLNKERNSIMTNLLSKIEKATDKTANKATAGNYI